MARSQVFNLADNFKAAITTAAWRNKPSWMLVPTKDRTINPTWSGGMPSAPRAIRSKFRAPVTLFTSPVRRKWQL